MKQYLDLVKYVLENGEERDDRTGVGTISVFAPPAMRYDLRAGFPLVTTKKVHWKSIVYELLWFISGDTNTKYLTDNGVTIWNEWADGQGNLGPVYGHQWRKWGQEITVNDFGDEIVLRYGVDQLKQLIEGIKTQPHSRRHIVNAWNVGDLDKMALPPCHTFFQCYVSNDGYLDLQLYQRSADLFLGVPFNIASYSLLLHMVAHVTGLKPKYFIHTMGDAHIYKNHLEQVQTQLQRHPLKLPALELNHQVTDIDQFKYEDIVLKDYESWPGISAPIAI